MLLLSCASAQTTGGIASVTSIRADRNGDRVRIEITLSSAVQPASETASNPSRILIDLPNTTSNESYKSVPVNDNGVRRVRTGQHSTRPLVTRVVVDLDQSRQYSVQTSGNRIVVMIDAAENSKAQHSGPAPAASGSVLGSFFKRKDKSASSAQEDNADDASIAPPPSVTGPAFEPPKENSSTAVGTSAASPSAAPSQSVVVPANPPAQPSFDQRQVVVASATETPKTSVSAPSSSTAESQPGNPSSLAEGAPVPEAHVAISPATETEVPAKTEPAVIVRSDDPSLRTVFKVKYVADGVAYLEGGRAQGLSEGMKLEIEDTNLPATQGESANTADPRIVAELVVSGVAETSAVTDIQSPKRPVKVGDLAYLSSDDAAALVQQRTLSATRQYPAVISFTEGDTLDEEAREEVPRPPLPSVNRARGRIGFDDIETISHGTSNITSSDVGMVFRGDITRIGGTYWNLSGYWRGELTKASAASQQTLQSLLNRTYHLNMTYDNPNSLLVAGFGRLFLPWAPSLDTIDGGYFGRRIGKGTTFGIFGGSTPDPSSWDYSPDRVIGGSFVNFEAGEYNGLHFSSTTGGGISMINWAMDTPFVFLEDMVSYKRDVAVYESAQFDNPKGNSATPAPGPGLGRNFFTLRVNPHQRVELDFNYNYFRQIPTFDPTLVGTGLLDKYLFQGFSAGGRVEVWKQVWLSTNLGRSSGTGDAKSSLNEMFGITVNRMPGIRMRTDAHYARFNSSFGTGSYESISFSRQMSDRLRLEALIGQQNFASMITTNTRGRFITGTVETTLGPHYYLQGNFTTNRGAMSYDQVMFSIGYRFDSKRKGE